MKTRIITSIILLLVLVPLCVFANDIVFAVAMGLLAGMAVFEWVGCVKCLGRVELWCPLLLMAVLSPMCSIFSMKIALGICVFGLIYAMALQVLSHKRIDLNAAGKLLTGTFYIILGFTSLTLFRAERPSLFWLVFICAWGCDVFAYFGGKFFGKRKLSPEISPKKTIEGSIIGAAMSGVFFVLFALLFLDLNMIMEYILMFIIGVVAAIVSQMGDLIMSAVKRQFGIKDFGRLLPGHGGILDRFDSILLVAPALYGVFYCIL